MKPHRIIDLEGQINTILNNAECMLQTKGQEKEGSDMITILEEAVTGIMDCCNHDWEDEEDDRYGEPCEPHVRICGKCGKVDKLEY